MVSVKFIKPWSAYSPGDIAGFDEKRAESLVDAGAAKLHEAEAEAAVDEAAGEPAAAEDPAADVAEAPEAKPGRGKK